MIRVQLIIKKYLKNKYSQIFNSLSRLYETHLKNLENMEKINFFKQIINNLKLPDLSNEKEIIKKRFWSAQIQLSKIN